MAKPKLCNLPTKRFVKDTPPPGRNFFGWMKFATEIPFVDSPSTKIKVIQLFKPTLKLMNPTSSVLVTVRMTAEYDPVMGKLDVETLAT